MTRMQARKVAWAFCDSISLVEQESARTELIVQCARRLKVVEPEVDWRPVLDAIMKQCLEERAKEKQKAAADKVAAESKAAG